MPFFDTFSDPRNPKIMVFDPKIMVLDPLFDPFLTPFWTIYPNMPTFPVQRIPVLSRVCQQGSQKWHFGVPQTLRSRVDRVDHILWPTFWNPKMSKYDTFWDIFGPPFWRSKVKIALQDSLAFRDPSKSDLIFGPSRYTPIRGIYPPFLDHFLIKKWPKTVPKHLTIIGNRQYTHTRSQYKSLRKC